MKKIFVAFVLLFATSAFAGANSPKKAVKDLYKAAEKGSLKKAFKVLDGEAKDTYGNMDMLSVLHQEEVDAKKLEILYGFNELFNPFYSEDQELSIRAWRLGWKCYYEHKAICRHEVSGSTKNHSAKRSVKKLYFRNRYYVHYLHLNGFDLFLWHIQVIFVDVIMGFFTLQGYKASAYFAVFKNRRNLRRKKRNFNILMKKYNSKITLLNVIHKIRRVIENKSVIKL